MRTKVAIVGGGMGGLAAAFDLVAHAETSDEYEITIYERNSRLGGKGASGRSLADGYGQRIEEHGLHVLLGFYDNVFEILRTCYGDLRASGKLPSPPEGADWSTGVLHAFDTIYFYEPPLPTTTEWSRWTVPIAANEAEIGGKPRDLPTVRDLMVGALKWFVSEAAEHVAKAPLAAQRRALQEDLRRLDTARAVIAANADDDAMRAASVTIIQRILQSALARDATDHQKFVALYFAGLCLIGALRDILPNEANFRDQLDLIDFKAWIAKYNFLGLDPSYHSESAPVNAVYDLAFSRTTGFAAGSAFYDTLLMLTHYNGHIFYKMAGGMGDVVFAPIYLWLKENEVKVHFEFYHDLKELTLSSDQTKVKALVFDVPSDPTLAALDPILSVDCHDDDGNEVTLPCWPVPDDVTAIPTETKVVTDFDLVVLAIPVGAIREKNKDGVVRCQALFVDPLFAKMANGMVTQATRAVQLWFNTDLAGLGWEPPPDDAALGPVLGSYQPPFKYNSWADMTQVLPRETWAEGGPQNIAYLCDALVGAPADAQAAKDLVHDDAIVWLEKAAAGLWPNVGSPFDWNLLYDPKDGAGEARFDSQYWRANVDGSEQYVTGAPNTTALRLDPHGTSFTNLFLAGDWVQTPLNAGSVEGAAMGGRLAAQRIREQTTPAPAVVKKRAVAAAPGVAAAPPYVVRDGDLPLVQPVVLGDLTMHGYLFTADGDVLNATLDKTFGPLGITCTALLPVVLVTAVQALQIRSQAFPDDGYMTEAELGFWVAVHMKWDGGSSYGFYLPYLFVDNAAALLAGRDIYGFNKILGRFKYATAGDVDPTSVKAQVLHTNSHDTKLKWLTVASLSIGDTNTKTESVWASLEGLLSGILEAAWSFGPRPNAELAQLAFPSLPMFFLKQLRAASNGALTDFQQAITAEVTGDDVSGGWIDVSQVSLSLPKHATMSIASTLGLGAPGAALNPRVGFWATLNATVGVGSALGT